MTDANEQAVRDIVASARNREREALRQAVRDASADDRSVAAKALAGDPQPYRALHEALRELDIGG